MKLVKFLVSLACCLLFSTPLWAASNAPIDLVAPATHGNGQASKHSLLSGANHVIPYTNRNTDFNEKFVLPPSPIVVK